MICGGVTKLRALGRLAVRVCWLGVEIIRGALTFPCAGPGSERAKWLHSVCRRVARIFALDVSIDGAVPTRGLLVANHLSYLDIILLSSLAPCVFVAKSEVKGWPVFGWFARMAGTIFINRNRRCDTASVGGRIRAALQAGFLVVLFPEGTSSGGASVLPFKSSLLQAVVGERVPISVAALSYRLADGDPAHEVSYWGDHTLLPHLLHLMSRRAVAAFVRFGYVRNTWRDRKKLAAQLHAAVVALHGSMSARRFYSVPAPRRTPISDLASHIPVLRNISERGTPLPLHLASQ